MERVKFAIIQLGESKHKDEWNFLNKLKLKSDSKLFEITSISRVALPQSDFWGYADETLLSLVRHHEDADYTMCFIDYPLDGNFFVRRLSDKIAVATFFDTSNIFSEANVDLCNYVLLILYKAVALSKIDTSSETIRGQFHDETRGCLFDMCGLKEDIIVSATNPKICFDCEARLRKTLLDAEFLGVLDKELKRIRKSLYFRITDWIKKHPILSLLIAISSTILLNLIASLIYELLRNFFTNC
ncbi:MAG: hypothetical protein FWE44_03645 [Defluviitaleaceae bacterium]|nr:hypothetical protein [Defluviitaleaceae bacterium]